MDSEMRNIALTIMEGLNCPRSVGVAILIRYSEWAQIATMATEPLHYSDADTFLRARQASDLLRKIENLPTGIDREANARDKWHHAERDCFLTNFRLSFFVNNPLYRTHDPSIENVVLEMRRLIRGWIGRVPDWLDPKFGPGATISDKSRMCLIPDKLTSQPTATPLATFLMPLWRESAWGRAALKRGEGDPKLVRGNQFFLVPKDGKTRRACAKGPSINVSYQLAVGREIRRALRRIGIDLRSGQETHKRVACSSSWDDYYVTIDLTSASDCVAYNLVKLLLPSMWFDLLNWLREPCTLLDTKPPRYMRLEKFSAMGNGYTFELETMIYLSIVCAIDPELQPGVNVWVYGDDIIVPRLYGSEVVSRLRYFGFTTNVSKTFLTGPFRESCGGDFWLGRNVRPHQMESTPSEPHEWIAFANGIYGLLDRLPELRRSWFRIIDQIPSSARLYGPVGLGDLVIHDKEHSWSVRYADSIRYVKAWSPARYRKVLFKGFGYDVQMASALYGVAWSEDTFLERPKLDQNQRYLVPREGVTGYAPKWVPYS